jgi:crotonobetainyl-CoA:carnitine CoA-transferase CaiB-like acyl-CoA transferase
LVEVIMKDNFEKGILEGARVLDFAGGLAGSVAALLLAEAGATVVKIEPPGGSALRGSGAFAVWNRSKSSVVLDVLGADRAAFDRLLKAADVLVLDLPPGEARRHGLDSLALARTAPSLIVCSVTGFPAGHPDDDLPADDTLVLAAAGLMDEQQPVRRDGPAYLRFPLGSWGAAWLAAVGVVVRLWRQRKGAGVGPVATSLYQGALVPMTMFWRQMQRPSPGLDARRDKRAKPSLFECQDGVWLHLMARPDNAPLMKAALEAMGPEKVAAANAQYPAHARYTNWGANVQAFLSRPSAEWLADLWASDIPAQAAMPMGVLYTDEQTLQNGYVVSVDDPELGKTLQPGPPLFVTPPLRVRSPSPRLNDGLDAIAGWDARSGLSKRDMGETPLQGLKVVDFGNYLAGPLTTMLLADLGADVIKVESLQGDPMRQSEAAFLGCQRGKRSLAVDLKNPASRPIVQRLAAWADVVHHNLRMKPAVRLGLGADDLLKINPRLIYAHVNAYGSIGPRKDWPGYDQLFQALSGWEIEGAGAGNPPSWHRFGMMDHQAALASLYGVVLALLHREATNKGGIVNASILGSAFFTTSEMVKRFDGSLTSIAHLNTDQTAVAPDRGIRKCADGWIAVILPDGVVESLNLEYAHMTVDEAAGRLREAGGITAPVRLEQGRAFFEDSRLRDLGLIAAFDHRAYGHLEQPGGFLCLDGLACRYNLPPPLIGEHSREVLAALDFRDDEIAEWSTGGVVAA